MVYQCKRKIALFTAMCLFCSMIELVIPKPAFIKIGFSNLPVMLSLFCGFSLQEYTLLVVLRVLSQALINGTILSYSFILSAAAGFSSAVSTYILFKTDRFSFTSISVFSAFVSNICQILLSSVLLGKGVYSLAPLILGAGLVCSFVLGLCTDYFIRHSRFSEEFANISFFATLQCETYQNCSTSVSFKRIAKIVFASAMILTCYFSSQIEITACCSLALLAACSFSGRRLRLGPILWLIFRTVLINILIPSGRVLFTAGSFVITVDSLVLGIRRSLILLSSIWFSQWIIPPKEELENVINPNSIIFMIFEYFKNLNENWKKVDKGRNLLERVDNTLAVSIGIEDD